MRRPPTPPLFPYTTLFRSRRRVRRRAVRLVEDAGDLDVVVRAEADGHALDQVVRIDPRVEAAGERARLAALDRKSTRLNSSHLGISYAVFCLKKKKYEPVI